LQSRTEQWCHLQGRVEQWYRLQGRVEQWCYLQGSKGEAMVPFAGQDRVAVKCAGEQGREKRWHHVQGSKGEAMVPFAGEQGWSNSATICRGVGEAMVPPFAGE